MQIDQLWLSEFRSYESFETKLASGRTLIVGPNGIGKSNMLEALGLLATLKSFRGAATEHMVRVGSPTGTAIVRALGTRDDREVLIEVELGKGRTRAQVNRQRLKRARDLLGALRVTVFAPDDLALVKAGPSGRRDYLDDLLVALDPATDSILSDLDRILRQRNALLRQCKGRLDSSAAMTLDVWDDKLAKTGEQVVTARTQLSADLEPHVADAYDLLAEKPSEVALSYQASWDREVGLAKTLADGRDDDVRRGVSLTGPHRDELTLSVASMPARIAASQGEQRTLTLALRLAGHRLVTDRVGEPPLLLLDDVLSELDPNRSRALLANLPVGQTVITNASPLPDGAEVDDVVELS